MPPSGSSPHLAAATAVLAAPHLAALARTALLDTAPEGAFDRYTRLVARLLEVPVALVSLVGADRQFFESCVALPAPWADARRTPLTHSFCQHVVANAAPLAIDDARTHPVLRDNGAVADLGIVAYLGVPIVAEGEVVGSLCAIDGRPRAWTDADRAALEDLAAAAGSEVALRRALQASDCVRGEAERARAETRLLLDTSPDAFLAVDGTGRCTYVSEGAARWLGRPAAALAGTRLVDHLPPAARTLAAAIRARTDAAGGPVDGEYHLAMPGIPDARWVHVRAVPGAGGAITAAIRDVTERRVAQAALRASEARARAVSETASDAIVTADADDRIVFWNAAAARLFGYAEVEALGQPLALMIPPDHRAAHAAGISRAAAGGAPHVAGRTIEVEGVRRDGVRFPMELSLGRWDIDGRPYVTSIIRDVSGRTTAEEALRAQHALFAAVMEGTTDALWVKDRDGVYQLINGPGARMLGCTVAEVVGRTEQELFTPESAAAVRARDLAVLAAGATRTEETASTAADGSARAYLTTRAPLRDAAGRTVGVVGVSRDITERQAAARALAQSHALLAATLEATVDAILVIDPAGRMTGYNQKLLALWGIPVALAVAGDAAPVLRHVLAQLADPEAFLACLRHTPVTADAVFEDVLDFADGRVVERHSHPQRLADGTIVGRVFSFRDVTERRRLEQRLAHQAFHDPLTGLANRALFRDRVAHALERRSRGAPDAAHVAVAYLDLDDFKQVNDSYGHAAGDRLLTAVAGRLLRATRGADTVARLGGDEFAVLLEGLAADAEIAVARIAGALAAPAVIDGREVGAAASVGLVHIAPGATADDLLRDADTAMYRAKAAGKGRTATFAPAMRDAVLARHALERELRAAVAAPDAAFHLAYQPIVGLDTGAVVKFEALLRWRHPQRGLVSPAEFIPVAEETGLIVPLGRWVLETACRQLRAWDDAPALARVAVNVSGRQLEAPGFVAEVAAALTAAGVAPGRVTLEVTETALMHDTARVLDTLHALKALGVELAIDDFGTGYSSLASLQRFPVDVLKIDKAFVDRVARGGSEAALARTVVALGQALGLHTIAEGVETEAQRAALAALGCPLGQGYLFARPLSAANARACLAGAPAGTPVA